jgi:hypothetical protein
MRRHDDIRQIEERIMRVGRLPGKYIAQMPTPQRRDEGGGSSDRRDRCSELISSQAGLRLSPPPALYHIVVSRCVLACVRRLEWQLGAERMC